MKDESIIQPEKKMKMKKNAREKKKERQWKGRRRIWRASIWLNDARLRVHMCLISLGRVINIQTKARRERERESVRVH